MVVAGLVSVVATVLNEADNIDEWISGLLNQSRSPDEIVIVDGGSTDDTLAGLNRHVNSASVPIVVVSAPGTTISEGRNIGITRASSNLIAVTDAGTRASIDWLERLVDPLLNGEADVASGFFVPRLDTWWQRVLAATTLPDVEEIEPASFLPSSRSMAFRRQWFDAGVRYPEWLDYCEDLIWDMSMRRAGARFVFVSNATVTFDVRPSAIAFTKQYFRYARGDGKAGLFARRHAARYVTYVALATVLVRKRPVELLATALLGANYVLRPIQRLLRRDRASGKPLMQSVALIPGVACLRALGDVAKMAGYPVGLLWRWRRYGGLGWRTSWRRISPDGSLFHPATSTRENPPPQG